MFFENHKWRMKFIWHFYLQWFFFIYFFHICAKSIVQNQLCEKKQKKLYSMNKKIWSELGRKTRFELGRKAHDQCWPNTNFQINNIWHTHKLQKKTSNKHDWNCRPRKYVNLSWMKTIANFHFLTAKIGVMKYLFDFVAKWQGFRSQLWVIDCKCFTNVYFEVIKMIYPQAVYLSLFFFLSDSEKYGEKQIARQYFWIWICLHFNVKVNWNCDRKANVWFTSGIVNSMNGNGLCLTCSCERLHAATCLRTRARARAFALFLALSINRLINQSIVCIRNDTIEMRSE